MNRQKRWAFIGVSIMSMVMTGCSGGKPDSIGTQNGRLSGCPDSPNCVSSYSADEKHRVLPLRLAGDMSGKWQELTAVINNMPRTTVIQQTKQYIHAQCRSRVFRFVDDLELLLDLETGVVHIRSASRVGYSDLGVNRKRVDSLREILLDKGITEE